MALITSLSDLTFSPIVTSAIEWISSALRLLEDMPLVNKQTTRHLVCNDAFIAAVSAANL